MGNHAQLLSVTGNAFVIGLGGRDPASILASTVLDGTVLAAATIGFPAFGIPVGIPFLGIGPAEAFGALAFIRAAMNVDIVWPPGNPSRLVFAHEFGHHAFYQQIVNASLPPSPSPPFLYAAHLNTIFIGTVSAAFGPVGPGNAFFEPLLLNEAMADIFADQLAGGGNRLSAAVPGAYAGDGVGSGMGVAEAYCNPAFPAPGLAGCFDANITGTETALFAGPNGPLNLEASRISTALHDIFDDSAGLHHNGQVWTALTAGCAAGTPCPSATTIVANPGPSSGFAEDAVAVPFPVILNGIRLWLFDPLEGLVYSTNTFMHGMTRSMRLAGVADGAICGLYGLHTPGGMCPAFWMFP